MARLFAFAAVFAGLVGGRPNFESKRQISQLRDSYDFIIVGGGTSGLTVADRLTEAFPKSNSPCGKFDLIRLLTFTSRNGVGHRVRPNRIWDRGLRPSSDGMGRKQPQPGEHLEIQLPFKPGDKECSSDSHGGQGRWWKQRSQWHVL